jgi:hypothetical protein
LASLNLVGNNTWSDLISGSSVDLDGDDPMLTFEPYQAIWLANLTL